MARFRGSVGWRHEPHIFLLALATLQLGGGSNIWKEVEIPPYISCDLPQCDPMCENIESGLSQICPRTASTNLNIYGELPGPLACFRDNLPEWESGRKISEEDPDGCGPCLLAEEKGRCNINSGAGRGYNAGGPPPRRGHSMVVYKTPIRSRYVGATMLVIFGGVDRNDQYLNDVWWRCIDGCRPVVLNKRTFNEFGVAIDYPFCPEGSCEWEEKVLRACPPARSGPLSPAPRARARRPDPSALPSRTNWTRLVPPSVLIGYVSSHERARVQGVGQRFIDWVRYKEIRPSSLRRRGVVPSRPAGREGHAVALTTVRNEFDQETDIMVAPPPPRQRPAALPTGV